MNASEDAVDKKYRAEGWYDFSNGWPDRAYVRINDGKTEIRFVEVKGPKGRLSVEQELMHAVLLSKGIRVEIEPTILAPKYPIRPIDELLQVLQMLEARHNNKLAKNA